jgi:hypothetical protein
MTRIARRAAALLVLAALVTGCGVTVYEPGVYKGEKDPLLAMHAKPEHKAQLQERFTKGQAER